jgi:iron-sulfur cluster assembly protein
MEMAVSLTDSAARRVKACLSKRGHGSGLRIGIKGAGCSGFAYVLDYADEISAADKVFEEHGLKVVIAVENLPYIDGSQIDYVKDGLNEKFVFHNPNASGECGCGESFSV